MSELKPFLVRLRPEVAELLAKAASEQNKPQAVIVNDVLRDALTYRVSMNNRVQHPLSRNVTPWSLWHHGLIATTLRLRHISRLTDQLHILCKAKLVKGYRSIA